MAPDWRKLDRRSFVRILATASAAAPGLALGQLSETELTGLIGITTGSLGRHLTQTSRDGEFDLLDLPKIMRDRLDLKVMDLMTANLPSMDPSYLERLRSNAEDCGIIITNLKMNQKGVDMASDNVDDRLRAIQVYRRSIDAAATLGCRWVRPLPLPIRPDPSRYVDSYRRLIDYAKPKGITLLIENFGWIQSDADAIPRMIAAVGPGLHASVDTGNWTNEVRYEGLEKAFPLAVTCDFKAFEIDKDGNHSRYNLKRCFQIGWDTGFRGPWCFEHFNSDFELLLTEMVQLREHIKQWSKEKEEAEAIR